VKDFMEDCLFWLCIIPLILYACAVYWLCRLCGVRLEDEF